MNPLDLLQRLDAIAPTPDAERDYLGASEIGHECERALWLKFNKYTEAEKFPPRMLRLFDRGHNEEYSLAKLVEGIGAEPIIDHRLFNMYSGQHGFSDIGSFFKGHGDGLYMLDSCRINVEYKTHNDKSFKALKVGQLKKVKPLHYAQCIVYPGYFNCVGSLYLAVNKNDDSLFVDWVPFDASEFEEYKAKARRIILAEKPPHRICRNESDWQAKFCHAKDVCFGLKMPRVHCRNCTSWERTEYGERCELGKVDGPCASHSFNPYGLGSCLSWEPIEFMSDTRSVRYDNGVINGAGGVASVELKC